MQLRPRTHKTCQKLPLHLSSQPSGVSVCTRHPRRLHNLHTPEVLSPLSLRAQVHSYRSTLSATKSHKALLHRCGDSFQKA